MGGAFKTCCCTSGKTKRLAVYLNRRLGGYYSALWRPTKRYGTELVSGIIYEQLWGWTGFQVTWRDNNSGLVSPAAGILRQGTYGASFNRLTGRCDNYHPAQQDPFDVNHVSYGIGLARDPATFGSYDANGFIVPAPLAQSSGTSQRLLSGGGSQTFTWDRSETTCGYSYRLVTASGSVHEAEWRITLTGAYTPTQIEADVRYLLNEHLHGPDYVPQSEWQTGLDGLTENFGEGLPPGTLVYGTTTGLYWRPSPFTLAGNVTDVRLLWAMTPDTTEPAVVREFANTSFAPENFPGEIGLQIGAAIHVENLSSVNNGSYAYATRYFYPKRQLCRYTAVGNPGSPNILGQGATAAHYGVEVVGAVPAVRSEPLEAYVTYRYTQDAEMWSPPPALNVPYFDIFAPSGPLILAAEDAYGHNATAFRLIGYRNPVDALKPLYGIQSVSGYTLCTEIVAP